MRQWNLNVRKINFFSVILCNLNIWDILIVKKSICFLKWNIFIPKISLFIWIQISVGILLFYMPGKHRKIQFSSVAQSCLTLCDPTDCRAPGFPVHHQRPELPQTHVNAVGDVIITCHSSSHVNSSSVIPFSSCLQSFPASGSFPMNQFFPSGGRSIEASGSTSVLPVNIQDWFPLGWTGWISLQPKTCKSLLQHHSSKASIL